MKQYINSEVERMVRERLNKDQIMEQIPHIISRSLSIRKGEMYVKTSNNNVELYEKMCSLCSNNNEPIGENIVCYSLWFCDKCKENTQIISKNDDK
jgi:hypothetical protein